MGIHDILAFLMDYVNVITHYLKLSQEFFYELQCVYWDISLVKFIKFNALSTYTQGMNRINKNFRNPKLHQEMFIKIPCRYWGGLIISH